MDNLIESIAKMQGEISELRRIIGCLLLFSQDKNNNTFIEFFDNTGMSHELFESIRDLHYKIEQLEKE